MKNKIREMDIRNQLNEKEEIGLKVTDKKIEFIFPKHYEITSNSINEMLNLLRLIDKYKILEDGEDKHIEENHFPFDAYLWIIKDYVQNGYYNEKQSKYLPGTKGNINWKSTIKNNKIYLGLEQIVYKELIVKSNFNIDNIITQIHRFCVAETINTMGWYYKINEVKEEKLFLDKETVLLILKQEYSKTYIDHKKMLLLNMIKIIEGVDTPFYNTKHFEITTNEFEYVFERLIRERFGNEETHKYNPKATWHIDGQPPKTPSPLRPDVIMKKGNDIYVIDAKYYKYGYSNNDMDRLPEAYSIHKQIIYAKSISVQEDFKENSIYNVFILPYTSKEQYIKYIGYATVDWEKEGNSYEKVHTVLIDLKQLIDNTFGSKNKNIDELISILEYKKRI